MEVGEEETLRLSCPKKEIYGSPMVEHTTIYGEKDITPRKNPKRKESDDQQADLVIFKNEIKQLVVEIKLLCVEIKNRNEKSRGNMIKNIGFFIFFLITFPISLPIIVFYKFGIYAIHYLSHTLEKLN